tara:strand:- start:3234 stop:6095 length:2862 start_codon:yes stop_codon:yes gene_type:complete
MAEIEGYIKNRGSKKSEFETLFEESIGIIQKLASDEWTDYNEHDPGVTIIENLVYTLTSLNYKSQFPIEDILVSGKGSALESGDNGFFEASEILTTNPVTDKDLRKLLIDRIENVKNVWVDRVNLSGDDEIIPHLNGVVNLSVELFDYENSVSFIKEKARVIEEVKKIYHQQRNLCEDLHNVEVLTPLEIDIELNMTVLPTEDGEEIMARVLYQIDNYFSKTVKFYSLEELQNKGELTDQIFNGPQLNNGFIPDAELQGKLQAIVPSEIVRILSKLEGVISVNTLKIFRSEEFHQPILVEADKWKIEADRVPRLNFPTKRESFVFKMNNTSFSPNLQEVRRQLSYIEAVHYGIMKSASQANNSLGIPTGNKLALEDYLTVRHQFPALYGIGSFGLASHEPAKRFAQAEQLKAFLLPFDQLMANGLAQLNNIYELYNMNSNSYSSYAFQVLQDMSNLTRLIETSEGQKTDQLLSEWELKLQKVNTTFDTNAVKRLNQVINSILARFSEEFPTYELKKIYYDSYGRELTDQFFEYDALDWKRQFAQGYGNFSYNRAKGRNYTVDINGTKIPAHVSGILRKVCALMGIQNDELYPLNKVIQESGIKIYQTRDGDEILGEKLIPLYEEDNDRTISMEDVVIINESIENLWDSFYYIGNSHDILKDILKEGVNYANYQIKQSEGEKALFYITFTPRGGTTTNAVHVSGTKERAEEAVNEATRFLMDVNKKSEGIYMLEHVLLAPPYQENFFGFSFNITINTEKKLPFQHIKKTSLSERNKTIQQLDGHGKYGVGNLSFEVILVAGKFVVRAYSQAGEQLAESVEHFVHQSDAEYWAQEISKTAEIEITDFVCYAYYGENKVDETFFTFRMSFVLPDWPARFQDNNFRTQLNDIVYESAPAHIAAVAYWIPIREMAAFEELYFSWLRLPHNGTFSNEQMELCYSLIEKLKQYATNNGRG